MTRLPEIEYHILAALEAGKARPVADIVKQTGADQSLRVRQGCGIRFPGGGSSPLNMPEIEGKSRKWLAGRSVAG